MKFKVGDRVRIKPTLNTDDTTPVCWVSPEMIIKRGQIYPIAKIAPYGLYGLDLDNNKEDCWWFTEEMLEPAYADGGFCTGFKGGKIPTPEKPIPIEEQFIKDTGKDRLDSAFEAWRKLGGATSIIFKNGSSITTISKEDKPMKFTFYTKEGYRIDKSNNSRVETITTYVNGILLSGEATCDKTDYDERQGVLEALANAVSDGDFDKVYRKAVKANKRADEIKRTCEYCGKTFNTIEEKEAEEAWHVERRKARHERYLLRRRAKEIAFEEAAKKMAKEMIEDKK